MLFEKLKLELPWLEQLGLGKAHNSPRLGLDISNTAIKLVELSRNGRNCQVERYVIEPLPKEAVNDGNLVEVEGIAETIRRAWRRLDSPVRNVAIAIPTPMAIYKKILVPVSQIDDMDEIIENEAHQIIPFPLEEVNLDHQVLGPSPSSIDDMEVLLCAARKEKVEERVAVVEMAGLRPQVVDVESFAMMTAFEQIQQQLPDHGMNQTFALFDIGATRIHCNIIRNGQQIYYREQMFGGHQLTRDIQRRYNISFEEAETSKRSMALPDGYESELMHPFIDSLAQEIQRALQFFYTTVSVSQYLRVDYILLAGGCSMLPGLDDAVAGRTQISTMIANPFTTMVQSGSIRLKELLMDAPSLLIASGLALRRFD
ncbi:pilus assembly protein PilM [Chromobacterium amazonense]|uniref:Pilus assembly protein PilM n=1 Tax=Chromobacterium amazonense TaxID=1382803 RepID=A0A1S1X9D9_9NEIS|nr:pilus assembly protein PilM [Chromobacterium amazonense]KIA79071.1 pilus assembly protein PilM [Chromobacterium piscinae]MDE1714295.1 pilus assembly protein PilM [Chromobacterium amazonense]MDQ4540752.1 pilus assembly protein PilM [Chromobacterium amazonense]OHX15850.1 pilus assembly protein PilM [Chromobacterium amazonense]PRP72181.1 pilus assembly protein PilM [Chromobacterium amazonense]